MFIKKSIKTGSADTYNFDRIGNQSTFFLGNQSTITCKNEQLCKTQFRLFHRSIGYCLFGHFIFSCCRSQPEERTNTTAHKNIHMHKHTQYQTLLEMACTKTDHDKDRPRKSHVACFTFVHAQTRNSLNVCAIVFISQIKHSQYRKFI